MWFGCCFVFLLFFVVRFLLSFRRWGVGYVLVQCSSRTLSFSCVLGFTVACFFFFLVGPVQFF